MKKTLFDKVWEANTVVPEQEDRPAILFVGLHLLHEISSLQAFSFLEQKGLTLRHPELTLAMVDHCAPTAKDTHGRYLFKDEATQLQIKTLEDYCHRYRVECLHLGHRYQGIVHAVGPELGLSIPGQVIVCGDSHTSTHGALGAIAFGIGSSEVCDVLATQCLLQRKPKNMRIIVEGVLPSHVSAKDLALFIITKVGAFGGAGYAIEYQGEGIQSLSIEERLTLCNMTIEAGSRFGIIAPDDKTWNYLNTRPFSRVTEATRKMDLTSDHDAPWDKTLVIQAKNVPRMISWGTNPAMSIPLSSSIPLPQTHTEELALAYMGWQGGQNPAQRPVNHVFIGSCTNGRLSDIRKAAHLMRGKKVAVKTRCLVVCASSEVKRQAEAEGLDQIFRDAGAIWGEPSCSLCNAMNGDVIGPGELIVSTSNRNFEGRQGPRSRSILVSPETAAEIALRGTL